MTSAPPLEFMSDLEGIEVTFHSSPNTSFTFPTQTWVIAEKLSESPSQMTQRNIDDDLGPSFTAAKFLCHRADNPAKMGFMRIYLQVPIIGTEFRPSKARAKQGAPPKPHAELSALKSLKAMNCEVVPDLLCYQEQVQGQDGIVPGGYITYIVWDKVPGESLSPQTFWNLDLASRQEIRSQFRIVYQ